MTDTRPGPEPRPWIPHDVEFFSDIDRPEYAVALWAGHRWFGYDLVRWARPRRIVELGSHYGCSFFAFCQAVQADRSDCELVAVDNWEGDEHTGHYGEEVYQTFTGVLERRFAGLDVRVQRSTFDDALDVVADGSVDILHIDGLHTYEAVRHDYETWQHKVAPNGIVLFHDVAPSSGLGSARYWQEIRETGPSFAFLHSFGLGVLLPNGTEGREALLHLGHSMWRPYYEHRAGHDLRSRQVIDLTTMVDARDQALAATEQLVAERDQALAATERMVAERDQVLAATERMVVDRDQALAATEQLVAGRDEALVSARGLLDRRDRDLGEARDRLRALDVALGEARRQADQHQRQLAAAGDRIAALEAEVTEIAAQRDRETARADAAAADAAASQAAEVEHLHHQLAAVTVERDALGGALERYRQMLKPVRWAARPPRKVLRRMRGIELPGQDGPIDLTDPADRTDQADGGAGRGGDRPPTPALFDATWYLARYPDVARAGVDPWTHWVDHGWREGREACPLFSAGHYLAHNRDVADAGVEPLGHWAEHGWREGRDPSALFDTTYYLDAAAGGSEEGGATGIDREPLGHYLDTGLAAGLFVSPAHEEQVLASAARRPADDEVLVDVVIHGADGEQRSVPYSMLADLDADLVTFDLWDTILTRSRPADASKLATARRIRLALGLGPDQGPSTWELLRRRVAIEAEIAGPDNGEYLLGDVLARLLPEVADPARFGDRGDLAALADHLRRAELEDEMASTAPIADTVAVMEKLLSRGDGTRVAVLSDFYLSGDDLGELLAYHGLSDDRLEVVSSADLDLSKHAGGALFGWSRERYGVDPARHLHVGDNPHADVAMQTATGGTAVHLVHGRRRHAGPGQLDETTMADTLAALTAELDGAGELRCREAGLRPRPEDRIVRAAWRTALLPVALVAAAIEDASARDLDRIHYLSREGRFLARIHDEVAPILAPHRAPAAVHLAVSRRSTFGPSLSGISADSLMDLWRMYSRQTPRGLLVSLGAEAEAFADEVRRAGLALDETIDGIHLDQRVRALLDQPSVNERLVALNATRREALLDYLGRNTDLGLDQWLVVDVGWRGTVQDNLARLLPGTGFVGWYLALFPFLNPQGDNCAKFAIGPDGNDGEEFAFMEPPAAVERPWTPAEPSVVDYRMDGSAGSVPVLDEEALDDGARRSIAQYQDAVVEAAPMVARWIVANGAGTDVLRPLIRQALDEYYRNPEPGIADLWFDSAHDDTFGVLNVTSFGKDRPGRHWLADGTGPGFLRHVEHAADSSLWPAGYRRWQPVQAATALERALRSKGFEPRR